MSTPEQRAWWRTLGLDSRHRWTDIARLVTRKVDAWNWTMYMQYGGKCQRCEKVTWW